MTLEERAASLLGDRRYSVVEEEHGDGHLLCVAMRTTQGAGVVKLLVSKERYDGIRVLEVLEKLVEKSPEVILAAVKEKLRRLEEQKRGRRRR